MLTKLNIPNHYLYLMNQVFDIEKKLSRIEGGQIVQRNLDRMKGKFQELGLDMHNPLGEAYNETRTDCEANIAGESSENLVIAEVIKPIIRVKQEGSSFIVQKAVVIVESKK